MSNTPIKLATYIGSSDWGKYGGVIHFFNLLVPLWNKQSNFHHPINSTLSSLTLFKLITVNNMEVVEIMDNNKELHHKWIIPNHLHLLSKGDILLVAPAN